MVTDAQRQWVARVLHVESPVDAAGDPGDVSVLSRLEVVQEDVGLNGLRKEFGSQLAAVEKAVADRSPGASALLDKLEAAIMDAVRRQRQQATVETIKQAAVTATTTVVSFAKARLKLQAARSAHAFARDNLRASCEALLKTPQFAADPRSTAPGTSATVASIGDAVPDIEDMAGTLDDTLDRMREALDPQVRAGLRNEALQAIAKYRGELDRDPLLSRMQDTGAGKFAIKDAIAGALDELEHTLAT